MQVFMLTLSIWIKVFIAELFLLETIIAIKDLVFLTLNLHNIKFQACGGKVPVLNDGVSRNFIFLFNYIVMESAFKVE